MQPCELSSLAQRCLAALKEDIATCGAEIDLAPLPQVTGDPDMLSQAMFELISNAIKYNHPDRPLRVSIRGGKDQNLWWLTISDNGRGLPAVGSQHLFEAFSRFNSEDPDAIGLGLAVCREVAEMHGGVIEPHSLAEGTAFTMRVPTIPPGV